MRRRHPRTSAPRPSPAQRAASLDLAIRLRWRDVLAMQDRGTTPEIRDARQRALAALAELRRQRQRLMREQTQRPRQLPLPLCDQDASGGATGLPA
jgi:hypothetical protein